VAEKNGVLSFAKKIVYLTKFRYLFISYLLVFIGFQLIFVNYLYRDIAMNLWNVFGRPDTTSRLLVLFLQNGFLQFLTILAFCSLFYNGLYVFNDIMDAEDDKKHPVKQFRAIPSGKITKKTAFIYTLSLIVLSLVLSAICDLILFLFLLIFLAINLIYSLGGRSVPYLALVLNSFTYPLRFQLGMRLAHGMFFAFFTDFRAEIQYLIVTIEFFLLALIISVKKRQIEKEIAAESRPTLKKYDFKSLELIGVISFLALVFFHVILFNIALQLLFFPVLILGAMGLSKKSNELFKWFWK